MKKCIWTVLSFVQFSISAMNAPQTWKTEQIVQLPDSCLERVSDFCTFKQKLALLEAQIKANPQNFVSPLVKYIIATTPNHQKFFIAQWFINRNHDKEVYWKNRKELRELVFKSLEPHDLFKKGKLVLQCCFEEEITKLHQWFYKQVQDLDVDYNYKLFSSTFLKERWGIAYELTPVTSKLIDECVLLRQYCLFFQDQFPQKRKGHVINKITGIENVLSIPHVAN